ncbi:MAG: NUDIX hydrolase [Nitrososphaera sp.]|nr:NUDIX hydrolase [Nitrososphaera sp.]
MTIHDFGIFKVVHDGKYSIIHPGDWANVVALTPKNEVILVRQHRIGSGETGIELPGGKVDAGESPIEAARRELCEETGYDCAVGLELLGVLRPNPAIMNNRMFYFLAQAVRKTSDQKLDADEKIEVLTANYSDIWDLVKSGYISHALTLAGLALYQNR